MTGNPSVVKKYIAVFSLGLCSAASFLLPFTKFYFYDQWVAALGCTNEQAGYLMTIYAFANTIFFIPGGWMADRFSAKKILVISTFATAGFNFLFAWNQNYYLAIFIWFGLAVTTAFAFWGALMKAVRLCGTDTEQGKMYGWYNGGDGLFAFVILGAAMGIYGYFAPTLGDVAGYQGALVFQGVACVVAALMVQFFFVEGQGGKISDDEKLDLKKIGIVAKNPATWYISVMIFCGYGLYTGSSYLNPYMRDVLGATAAFSGVMAILRTKGCRLVFGPVGGTLADKFKSSALVSIGSYLFIIAVFIFLLSLPMDPENKQITTMATIATFALMAGIFSVYGIMFSSISEANFPRSHTGTVIGLASIIGYSSDYFYNPMFGYWIDQNVNGSGYRNIFFFLMGTAVLGIIASFLVYRHGRKTRMQPE